MYRIQFFDETQFTVFTLVDDTQFTLRRNVKIGLNLLDLRDILT